MVPLVAKFQVLETFLTLILDLSNHKVLNKPMEKNDLIKYSFGLDSGGTTMSEIN
jgi:hypothetical protein